ncbi:MAG: glycosyltransferase [Deltaproteobacteria bacterium]|nr:glycosyltransferase [Deltaproteobacteria bacterium]
MKLSILIPVYNEAPTVKQLINRILSARFDAEREIIIVNDASSDGTREILERIDITISIEGKEQQ